MSKALWYQLYEKMRVNDNAIKESAEMLWQVAMEEANPQDVRDFFADTFGIEMDDES